MQLQRQPQMNVQPSRKDRRRAAKDVRKHTPTQGGSTQNVGAMAQVADGLRLSGRLDESENVWRQLLADFPDQPQPYVGLGVLLSDLERHTEAYDIFKKAVTIAPNEFVAWRQFGHCLHNLRQFQAASIAFKKSIALKPTRADTHHDLGRVFFLNEQPDEALASYDKAIELKPDYALAYLGKGVQLQSLGRDDEARACFYKAIEFDPNMALPHFRLASMDNSPEEAEYLLKRLAKLSSLSKLPKPERVASMFSSASILHNRKEYDPAFERYKAGNDTLHEDYQFNRVPFKRRIDGSIAGFTPQVFETHKSAGSPSNSPIFIFGMPRSGTTLVETIISSHPDVSAGGEERKIAEITDALEQTGGALTYPHDIAQIKPAHLLPFGTQYLSHMARLHPGAKRATDKLPFNCLHLGLLAILFPNATFIHCTRDPIDTCLSCYFQYFGESQALSFSNDLADLGFVYAEYRRMMAHWHEVVPAKIVDVKYEDLITSQEAVSREMLAHAGLEWNDACLRFHEQERIVNTASHAQVRKPIYQTSVEKWRRYEAHLGPLQEALAKEG